VKLYKVYKPGKEDAAKTIAAGSSWEARKTCAAVTPGVEAADLVAIAKQEEPKQ
jgi:hypothetical protein